MYKCETCNKEFERSSQLNGHNRTHYKSKAHLLYLSNPKPCEECKNNIEWRIIRNKTKARFCSLSCASKNNRRNSKLDHKNDHLNDK
jgi:hypothetical protein